MVEGTPAVRRRRVVLGQGAEGRPARSSVRLAWASLVRRTARLTASPMRRADTVVFLGPTLSHADAARVLDADLRPPVRKGDVYRCLESGVATIAIIDGVFHTEPSVWHREILLALDRGV